MAYAERRGKGPRPWRVRYKVPGGEASQSGFETKQAALNWGRDQEARVRAGTWADPAAGEITVTEWIDRWNAVQDVGISTAYNREYLIRRFIRPYWGARQLNSLTGEEITAWENDLPTAADVSRRTARDARCGRAVKLRLEGKAVAHKSMDEHCPGSGQQPSDDASLACWLPVKGGLTPHGLRHSHKTWMAEDAIPEILAEQRLGHDVPGMRGLYAHASQRMREELLAALQARWEQSLGQRAGIHPRSPVPLLDSLLAPFRSDRASAGGTS